MSSVNLEFSTLGELIQRYRQERGMTQANLAELSGVSSGSISKIENGEIRRPDFKTIQPIISVLEIPLDEVLDPFMLTNPRSETLFTLLYDSFSLHNASLSAKLTSCLLESEDENSEAIAAKLLLNVQQVLDNTETKLALLDVLIGYARSHGMQSFVAQGTFQKYLVERDDFSKLEETFQSGKYILQYKEFLTTDERITLYYKLGVHAYNLRKFNECIELCKRAIIEDESESSFKAYSTLLICSSYFHQEKFELAEKYLKTFSLFNFPFVKENVDFMTAKLNQRKGKTDLAITQLQECLKTSFYKINIVNTLIELYLSSDDVGPVEILLHHEPDFHPKDLSNPISKAGYAHYFLNKGKYMIMIGKSDEALSCFIKSAITFSKISMPKHTYECLEFIFQISKDNHSSQMEDNIKKLFAELKNEEGLE
ncbi:helix-turn-helix domain-containing protein [Paenibacillus thiaminolyticus]|uniref:Helix-turn-helix domain-containing protein n=1 Tax=Paenibacillus thiaminolyticus TaxID=49283 RepID=A0AAP9DVG6_PANTH|nr:helix-turn-helix transcriptional regulator [Paenibacillus thiaminolyticus]MCY9538292.1 helix-turn-helix domain-containing protein [Paenibacillus thiaminolyticus]MCY9604721.1 helix-turn-helix domain-containing protein [Paenibacillus thiaminolyticus]MCY9607876.1 helix-turn-helix domain-containing protein [Paenibacillus thiaminolyticus]MCY9615380.1 helix-turn-helix domain-containing protein [Paenibacillus thiaminolyticus]MCY9622169.1 helix-turn-helix domain-containing protein [Paenibacillus th